MTSDSPAASAAAEQVASVLQAAEQAAAQLRLEAEERLRSRIAEGDRAAELRVSAAEEEATEILAAARDEAKRIVSEASSKGLEVIGRAQSEADRLRAEAAKGHDEASWRAQDLMRAAEQTAAEIDIEGMQIVRDLRELGDSLRATPSAYSGTCRRSTPGCWVRSSASQLALHERSGAVGRLAPGGSRRCWGGRAYAPAALSRGGSFLEGDELGVRSSCRLGRACGRAVPSGLRANMRS